MEPIQIFVLANSAEKMRIGYAEVPFSRFVDITPEKIENGEFFLYDGALVVKKMSSNRCRRMLASVSHCTALGSASGSHLKVCHGSNIYVRDVRKKEG